MTSTNAHLQIVNAYLVEYFARARFEGNALSPLVNQFTLYYVYIFFISLVSWTIATAAFIHTASRISRQIKTEYFAAVLRQNMAIFDDAGTGDISSHLNANTIQEAMSAKLATSIAAIGNLAGTIAVCFALDWALAFILSWSFILRTVVLVLTGKATARYSSQSLDASSAGSMVVEEALGNIKTTTALGLQSHVHKTYLKYLRKASKHGFVLKILNSSMISLCVASGYINVALGFWQGSRRLTEGITPFANVVAIAIVLKSAAFVVLNVGSNLEAFNMGINAAGRMHSMIDRVSPVESTSGNVLGNVDGAIELRNIKHIYPHRREVTVLDNVSITFPARKMTAIVGPSGSGKSSIASLILRFYNPVAGDIFLDGSHNIASLDLQWLRQQIHFVGQEPFLFNKTIYENIEFGLTGPRWERVSEKEKRRLIYKAAEVAQAHQFISTLPCGYDTVLGASGSRLSGGQAQRVAIARAIVSQPRILILDEATSALDGETEARVLSAMSESCEECTRIVIAHRLSTVRDADKIIVLRSGHVAEEGTHSGLMEKRSDYFELVNAQSGGQRDNEGLSSSKKENFDKTLHKVDLEDSEEHTSDEKDDATVLVSEEFDKAEPSVSLLSLLRFGWRLNHPELGWMVLGLICSALAGLEEPASAILFAKSIASISRPVSEGKEILSETSLYSWMFLLLAIAAFLVLTTEGVIFGWCSEKMINRARSIALGKLLRMDVSFFDNNSAGALSSFLSSSTTDLAGISGSALSIILICASTAVCGILAGMLFGWKLALLCLSLFPAQVASGYFEAWLLGEFDMHTELFNQEAAELASETLLGIRTIAALSRQDKVLAMFKTSLRATSARALKANLRTSLLYALAQAIYYAGMALTFWYGSKLIIRHEYELDQFIVVQSSMLMSAYSAGLVFSWSPSIGKAIRASAKLEHLLSQKSAIDPSDVSDCIDPGTPGGRIDFDSVTFCYPSRPDVAALKNLSFSIAAGSNVAFVGPTGSGKSTIISMIERFYDPAQGIIKLDKHSLASLQVAKYRQCIGFVNQDPTLYNGTIKMNLLAGLNEEITRSSDAAVENACRQANIYEFIKNLPQVLLNQNLISLANQP